MRDLIHIPNNIISVVSDGTNAYVRIQANGNRRAVFLLLLCIIIEVLLFSYFISFIDPREFGLMIIPFSLMVIAFIFFPIRFLLWNIYGYEDLIVNSKSISWNYDYGLYKTSLKTVVYNQLTIGYSFVNEKNDDNNIVLEFYDRDKLNNLNILIHKTTVPISLEDLINFDNQLNNIFINDFYDKSSYIPFSIN